MDLSSYDGLKASIAEMAWKSQDSGFVAAVPAFVTACEHLLNYGSANTDPLRVREMETSVSLVPDAGGLLTLPADYLEWRGPGTANGGLVVSGNTFSVTPRQIGAYPFTYYARIPPLSAASPTNWLLAKAPMVYLYGSLIQAAPYMGDEDGSMIPTWSSLFGQFLVGLQKTDKRARFARVSARVSGPTP